MDNNGALTSILYGLEGYHEKFVLLVALPTCMHLLARGFYIVVFMTVCN